MRGARRRVVDLEIADDLGEERRGPHSRRPARSASGAASATRSRPSALVASSSSFCTSGAKRFGAKKNATHVRSPSASNWATTASRDRRAACTIDVSRRRVRVMSWPRWVRSASARAGTSSSDVPDRPAAGRGRARSSASAACSSASRALLREGSPTFSNSSTMSSVVALISESVARRSPTSGLREPVVSCRATRVALRRSSS